MRLLGKRNCERQAHRVEVINISPAFSASLWPSQPGSPQTYGGVSFVPFLEGKKEHSTLMSQKPTLRERASNCNWIYYRLLDHPSTSHWLSTLSILCLWHLLSVPLASAPEVLMAHIGQRLPTCTLCAVSLQPCISSLPSLPRPFLSD